VNQKKNPMRKIFVGHNEIFRPFENRLKNKSKKIVLQICRLLVHFYNSVRTKYNSTLISQKCNNVYVYKWETPYKLPKNYYIFFEDFYKTSWKAIQQKIINFFNPTYGFKFWVDLLCKRFSNTLLGVHQPLGACGTCVIIQSTSGSLFSNASPIYASESFPCKVHFSHYSALSQENE